MITYNEATGAEVLKVAQKITNAIENEQAGTVDLAMMTMLIVDKKPTISADDLVKAVKDLSEWLVLYLDFGGKVN